MTAGGVTHYLDLPFFVLATQNPIEQEGTYPLARGAAGPVHVQHRDQLSHPSIRRWRSLPQPPASYQPVLEKVIHADKILAFAGLGEKGSCFFPRHRLCGEAGTRFPAKEPEALPFVKEWTEWGAGPRASQYLILAAKARAVMDSRYVASVEDVKAVVPSILRHRIITNFKAQAEGITSLDIIGRLLQEVKP